MGSFEEHPEYELEGLADGALGPDPLAALHMWLAEAEAAGLTDPNAMVVGTIASDGRPTSRTVLWKGVDQGLIDGAAVNGSARISRGMGWLGSRLQTGQVGVYVVLFLVGALWILRAVIR